MWTLASTPRQGIIALTCMQFEGAIIKPWANNTADTRCGKRGQTAVAGIPRHQNRAAGSDTALACAAPPPSLPMPCRPLHSRRGSSGAISAPAQPPPPPAAGPSRRPRLHSGKRRRRQNFGGGRRTVHCLGCTDVSTCLCEVVLRRPRRHCLLLCQQPNLEGPHSTARSSIAQ